MRIEAGEEDFDAIRPTPQLYDRPGSDRVANLLLNDGLPLLKVQWDVYNSTCPLIGCFGSWRSGKTRAGGLKMLQVGARNPWRPIYRNDNPSSVIITETMKVIRDSAYREMSALLPRELILREWKSPQNWRVRLVNGHDYIFRAWSGKFEGFTAIGTWLDEAQKLDGPDGPQAIWKNLAVRASDPRAVGRCTIATGLPEYGWLSEIFDQPNTPERETYLCSMLDNFYLDEETIRVLRASTTAEEAEVTIHGKWRKPESVIYYAFGDHNLVDMKGDPLRPIDLALDLGDKGAIVPSQRITVGCLDQYKRPYRSNGILVVDEMLPERSTIRDALTDFFADRPWRLGPDSKVYVDPKADRDEISAIRDVTGAGKSGGPRIVKREMKERGYSVNYGHRCVNSAFRDYDGNRRLFIVRHLPRSRRSLIPALLSHRRKPNGDPLRDNIVDHVLDCLRYIVVDQLPLRSESVRSIRTAA